MVESGGLENRYGGNFIEGSNPSFSAKENLPMSGYYAYVLKSEKDGKYYYGSTKDLSKRVAEHNKGKVKSTKSRRPLAIHYFEEFESKTEAIKRERFFKSIDGYKFLKGLKTDTVKKQEDIPSSFKPK